MKKRAFITAFILVTLLLVHVALATEFGTRPNYASNVEYLFIYYNGYIQVQPSAIQNGMHSYNGYIRYTNGIPADTGRLYTASGNGCHDSRILSRSYTYTDDINNPNPVHFYYGFNRTAHGTPESWPE
jgi:hypothetical protein